MPRKFVLVDHSLRNLGGHHYPYAYSVLQAAQRAGWQAVLVTNRKFRERQALPADWQVLAIFDHPSYSRHTLDTQAQSAGRPRRLLAGWWLKLAALWGERARTRLIAAFAANCRELFDRAGPGAGDLIFFATTSELDLAGLSSFLAGSRAGLDLSWHLQFHFGVFYGREPDYAAQGAAAGRMRTALSAALQPLAAWNLQCYCTTEQLSAQYRRLGVATFTTLPYPVHELFSAPRTGPRPSMPARIACLGHSRREKGYQLLIPLLRELWSDWFATGRAQLVLQTHRRGQRRSLEEVTARLGAQGGRTPAPLAFAGFPLALEQYAELLRSADLGLLLYDGARYYARCSGVLLEMLGAGVPVLVPAGSWLSEQIAEQTQLHLERVAATAATTAALNSVSAASCSDAPTSIACASAAATTALLVEFTWRSPLTPGTYLRFELEQSAAAGAAADGALIRTTAIVGARERGGSVRILFRLRAGLSSVRLLCSNAWHDGPVTISDLRCLPITGSVPPLGAIGLAFADLSCVSEPLRDLLEHLPHYQRNAAAYAHECAHRHGAGQIVQQLEARARSGASAEIAAPHADP
ncbi:MAG: hypothetical protein WCD08_00620 [Steroidobacteraceae bacterium]